MQPPSGSADGPPAGFDGGGARRGSGSGMPGGALLALQQQQQQQPAHPSAQPQLLRPGIATGDVVSWLDPATGHPYGVVRLEGSGPAGTGVGVVGGGGGPCGGCAGAAAFVLAPLDPSAPGFCRGSCWLEVNTQGPHLGFRSAAAGGRFLQARRRVAAGGSPAAKPLLPSPAAAGGATAQVAGESAGSADAAREALPYPPDAPVQQQSQLQRQAGGEGPSAAGAACAQPPGSLEGGAAVAAFARQLARGSRLVFYSPNFGVYEQFELLPLSGGGGGGEGEGDDPLAAPWQRVRVRLRSRLLPHVALEIELVRIGALAAPARAPSPPRRAPLGPAAADDADDERERLARIEAVVIRQWFGFVEAEKCARLEIEESVGQLLAEVAELREGTAAQLDWLRGQMAAEVDRLLRRLARREAVLCEVRRQLEAKLQWGVAAINRAARARLLRCALCGWHSLSAALAQRRSAAEASAARRRRGLLAAALEAWAGRARGAAGLRAAEGKARARASRRALARAWAGWRSVAHRRRALLPSLAASASARRAEVLLRAALAGWRGAAAEAGAGRSACGQRLERLRGRRLQRRALAALGARAAAKREARRIDAAVGAAATRGLLLRCTLAWRNEARRRAAAAAAVRGYLSARAASVQQRVAEAWRERAARRRRHEAGVARAREGAARRLLAASLAAWAGAAGVDVLGFTCWGGGGALGTVKALTLGGSGGVQGGIGSRQVGVELLARVWRGRRLRRAFSVWRAQAEASRGFLALAGRARLARLLSAWRATVEERRRGCEALRTCLRRKRIAFRAFKSWYWESLDADVREMMQAALDITEPSEARCAALRAAARGAGQQGAWGGGGWGAGEDAAAELLAAAAGLLPGRGADSWRAAAALARCAEEGGGDDGGGPAAGGAWPRARGGSAPGGQAAGPTAGAGSILHRLDVLQRRLGRGARSAPGQ
ncbi:hypothetical protein Rsub_03409 [Raphidocelis subcapitata]|uniref:Uncharacterized protein n=1 Tax=Raphidocelis subcapitata TaxID=307507 RepID=A0A2V0NXW7_9CHLO|nr:hypothetical protein Rsub_03409 [Raphidocelis subcapitata]|eukprot:GBF90413.1 hypothetical protein Rsub_03409 [Raphidocelis subcapitata]